MGVQPRNRRAGVERKTGFEPATSTLARLRSSQLSYFREAPHCTSARFRTKPCHLPLIFPAPPSGGQ